MTYSKPWAEKFDALLESLRAEWGGRISRPGAEKELLLYPEYRADIAGLPVLIEISGFPGATLEGAEAGDDVEYLRVRAQVRSDHRVAVSHEGLPEKLQKLFGLTDEFQTGNARFDKAYFLRTETEEDVRFVSDERLHALALKLEPFALLLVAPTEVRVSRMIKSEGDLLPDPIRVLVNQTARLAALVESSE